MALKLKYSASEHDSYNNKQDLNPNNLVWELVNYKILGLSKGLIIPDDLIAEMESYTSRNSFKKIFREIALDMPHGCCPRCLKAHMIKTAEKIGLQSESIRFLSYFTKGEAGHYGYYLDGNELIKI